MSAVSMQNVNVRGEGTVRVGSMTDGMLSGTDESGIILSIESGSTLDGTWLLLENNKLVAGDGVFLDGNNVTTGHSTSIETRIDPETGAFISTVVTNTPGEIAMELGKDVQIDEMDLSMNDGVRGKLSPMEIFPCPIPLSSPLGPSTRHPFMKTKIPKP